MAVKITEEFRVKNFGLEHKQISDFLRSQWNCSRFYVLWRIFWPLYHIGWIIASGVLNYQWATSEDNRVKWFVYLTNWTYFMLTMETIMEAIMVIYVQIWRKDIIKGLCNEMPWFVKILWVLYNIATTASLMVTSLYWSIIFKASNGVNATSFSVHGMNSVYVFLNLFLTSIPVRILHFYQPVLYGVVYACFTAIYYAADGTNIKDQPYVYAMMDWSKAKQTVIVVSISTFIAIPFMHLVTYMLYFCRVWIHKKLKLRKIRCQIPDGKENGASETGSSNKVSEADFTNGGFEERTSDTAELGKLPGQNSKTNLIIEKF